MAIHRKGSGTISIPGACFLCAKTVGVGTDEDFFFWHGVTGGQMPFIRFHPDCARSLAVGLNDDLRRLAAGPEEDEDAV